MPSRRAEARRRRSAAGALLLLGAAPGASVAQVVERNLPPAPTIAPSAIVAPTVADPAGDDTPIGPPLGAIVALGATDPVRTGSGLDLSAVARLDTAAARKRLRPFLGRPISRRLIAEITAEITLLYRRVDYPFLSVTTPEQEITGGVLRFRVVEFAAGRLTVNGAHRASADRIALGVRWETGAPIAAAALSQDLAWLNRIPFRQVAASFAPGAPLGASDLTLNVAETRPWRVYGGYASSGTVSGGRDRFFVGAQAAGPRWLPDAFASYQFTASPGTKERARYASHAARLDLPIGIRQALALTFDHVDTSQPVEAFATRQVIDEGAIEYHAALPPSLLPASTTGDLRLGIEANRVGGTVSFGAVSVLATRLDVVQALAGFSGAIVGAKGELDIDVSAHAGRRLAAGALGSGSSGPLYAYLNARVVETQRLSHRLALSGQLSIQATTAALPQTQQIAIGGPQLVRGYLLDDGAFDRAITLRMTLAGAGWRLPSPSRSRLAVLTLSAFADAGIGSRVGGQTSGAASLGIAVDYQLGGGLRVGGEQACALVSNAVTRAGTCRLTARATLVYG